MAFLKFFSGRTPQEHEQKGDELFAAELWGKAKIEYEKALEKLEKITAPDNVSKTRLLEKVHHAKQELAKNHKQNADEMLEAGFYDDARELYYLALELSEDPDLRNSLEEKLKQLDFRLNRVIEKNLPDYPSAKEETAGRLLGGGKPDGRCALEKSDRRFL